MFGKSWKSKVISTHNKGIKSIEQYGILSSIFGGFFTRISGKEPDQVHRDEEEGLLSSSSSSLSDAGVKKRLLLTKRSSQSLDRDDGKSQEQYVMILIGRFLAGVIITQGAYLLLTVHSQWDPQLAALYTGVGGFLISVGMAFSVAIRSLVSLLLPTICSSKGRSIAMAYALLILMSSPSANIIYNYQQLSGALTCGDELGYNMTRGLTTLMQSQQNAILSSMDDTIDTIIEAVEDAEQIFLDFAQKIHKIGGVVGVYNTFLRRMGNICEERLGAFFCIVPNFVAKQARKAITQPLDHAIQTIKKEFEFDMSYKHDFVYEANVSKTASEISADIMKEVVETTGLAMSFFDWVKFTMTFTSGFVFIAAIKYRYKYLTNPEFDNFYLTEQFLEYDKKKMRHGKVGVIPLKSKEVSLYVRPGRIWMSKPELKKFAKGFTFLTFNFIYTVVVLLIDYGFWRLLSFMTLSLSLRNQSHSVVKDLINKGISSVGSATGLGTKTQDVMKEVVGLATQGVGFMSIIYRSIATGIEKIASTEGYNFRIDKCLPRARAPDYAVYTLLLTLYACLYIVCILEPYLLRIRRKIMAAYYPEREKIRLLFLRTKILSKRGIGPGGVESLFKQALLDAQKHREEQKVDFFAKYASKKGLIGAIARCLSGRTVYRCTVCSLAGGKDDGYLFQRCTTFGCKAVYCKDCYEELHRMCMVCLVKESKTIQRERRLSKLGIEMKETVHRKEAEMFVDSSGISDSSASSSEDDELSDQPETEETAHLIRSDENNYDGGNVNEGFDYDNDDDDDFDNDNDGGDDDNDDDDNNYL